MDNLISPIISSERITKENKVDLSTLPNHDYKWQA